MKKNQEKEPREDEPWWEHPERIRPHDIYMKAADSMIAADNQRFAPLYHERKAFMLEQGHTEKEAEQEGRRFVAIELVSWVWCEAHNIQWVPDNPRDPHAHEYDRSLADKEMA